MMPTQEIVLAGLDGSNPLAFLAALGTLRSLDAALPDRKVRMGWRTLGAWRPVVACEGLTSPEQVLDVLAGYTTRAGAAEVLPLGDNLKHTEDEYRAYSRSAANSASSSERTAADFAAAFSCEAQAKEGIVRDTALRTMSGAGHQHFLGFMRNLIGVTDRVNLQECLIGPWRYQDPPPSMRWDPLDDRRYANRWGDPSKDQIRTVRGANRLAIEGLPLLPVMPVGRDLRTTGFTGTYSTDTCFTWPIWEPLAGIDVVRTLLALPELQARAPARNFLFPMGVVEIFRSRRITVGKFRSFTPARPV